MCAGDTLRGHALSDDDPPWSLDAARMLRRAELLFLPAPWAWYVGAALYAAYVLYIVSTCALLWARRRHYMLRKTPVVFPLASAACQLVLVTTHFARYLFAFPMPPFVAVWRNYVFFPLTLMFGLVARGMHVCFAVLWTRSLAAHWAAAVRTRPVAFLRPGRRPRAFEGASAAFASSAVRASAGLGDPALLAFMRRRLTHIVTGVLAAAHVLLAAAINAWQWPSDALDGDRRVPLAVELAGIVFAVLVYGVASSLAMLWALRGVRDAYGLRLDLKSALAYALPLYLLYTLSRWYCSLHVLARACPPFLWMLAALLTLHTATAVHPVMRTFRRAAYRPFVRGASADIEDVAGPLHDGASPEAAGAGAHQSHPPSAACLPNAPGGAARTDERRDGVGPMLCGGGAPVFARRFSVPSADRPAAAPSPRRSSLEGDVSAVPGSHTPRALTAPPVLAGSATHGSSSAASVQESDEGSRSSLARRLSRVPALDVLGFVPGTRTPVIVRHRPIPLATVLENEHLAAPFEAYTRRAFVYDTIVFYRMVQSFQAMCRERAERLGSAADVSRGLCPDARYARPRADAAHGQPHAERARRLSFAAGLFDDDTGDAPGECCCKRLRDAAVFIFDYFVRPRSPCEMNLVPSTRLVVTRALFPDDGAAASTAVGAAHNIAIPRADVFDAAVEEVLCNVGQCTYRNFLYALGESQPELKARYLVPVGRVLSPTDIV